MHAPNLKKFASRPTPAKRVEAIFFWVFRLACYAILLAATFIFFDITRKGLPVLFQAKPPFINLTFLLDRPETLHVLEKDNGEKVTMGDKEYRKAQADGQTLPQKEETVAYSAGGIFPCIVGTVLLVIGSMTIALILGVCSAVFLSEYARQGTYIEAIRLAILNLAGVPSIVFGLFGAGMFVLMGPVFTSTPSDNSFFQIPLFIGGQYLSFQGWGVSLLAGWFTLAFMVLPVIITASEESLRAVPKGFREGSLALGATQWQTIRSNVLPYALPGILTSSVLGIARVAGETAPIMFTAAFVVRDQLPWEGLKNALDFVFQGVMALPYHIYVVSSKIPPNEYTQRVQYGTAFVFLVVVMGIALFSILLRSKVRNRYKW